MNDKSIPIISLAQVVFLLVAMATTVTFFDISNIAKDIHTDAWIPIFISIFFSPLIVIITLKLAAKFPEESIISYLPKIVGNKLGYIIGFTISIFYFMISVLALKVLSEIIAIYLLPLTPLEIQLLLILTVVFYGTWYGVQSVVRLTELLVPFLFFMFIIILFLPIASADYSNLLPIAQNGIIPILKKVPYTFTNFIGINIILFFYPYINSKNKLNKTVTITVLGVNFIMLLLVTATAATFSLEVSDLYFPAISLFQKVDIPILFLERISLFLLTFIIPIFLTFNMIIFYTSVFNFTTLFKLRDHSVFLILLMPFHFILAITPISISEAFSLRNTGRLISNIFLFLPGILLLIIYLKEKVRNFL